VAGVGREGGVSKIGVDISRKIADKWVQGGGGRVSAEDIFKGSPGE
jgi:hypothetical protein